MGEQQAQLIFFGDQTVDTLPYIKTLARKSRSSLYAARFLRDCADVVQALLSELDAEEKGPYSRFETILELAEIYAEQKQPYEVIATVLFFVAQFGDLIIRAEGDPSILATGRSTPVYAVGLCTGLLPAAAAATANDVGELLRIGKELIALAFRLGLELWRSAHEIESAPGSWAVAIVNVAPGEIQNIINAFNEDMAIPQHRRIYISTLAHQWAAVSGPPSLFPELWSYSTTLASASKMGLPLGTPAHAPHVLPIDIKKVLGTTAVHDIPIRDKTYIISTSTCQPFEGTTLGGVLYEALCDITCRMLNLAGVIDYVLTELQSPKIVVDLVALGPSSQIESFRRALENGGVRIEAKHSVEPNIGTGSRDGSEMIAVVGMSAQLPGSEDMESFWENIQAGRTFESTIPESRFDLDTHYDATGARKNTTTTAYGSFLDNPELFDSRLFNISPREAKQMDPIQRILLMCSYEALQMAGYSQEATLSTNRKRIATYFGQSADDWREANSSQDVDIFFIQGSVRPFASGRLNYHYKWAGGNYSVDSACAASSTSVILAVNALLSRECDTALAGGGSIYTATSQYAGLSRAGFLSKTPGGCKTFREDADGYLRGEGVGLVVLKRLEDAIAENDNVLAVLRRGARNYSWNSTSITHPSAEAQVSVIREVLRNASVGPDEIGFVEMHGTGTQAGDAIEMEAMTTIFGNGRIKDNPLYVGAVKANVGHGEAASGVTSLIKSIQMIRNNTIPPQPGFPGPRNSKFTSLDGMNIRIPDTKLPFKLGPSSHDGKRKILINNFDAAGGNNSLLLEDAPPRLQRVGKDPRSYHSVLISAQTPSSLQKNIQRLISYLENHENIPLSNLAYTTTARRIHEPLRKGYAVRSISELQQLLEADIKKNLRSSSPVNRPSVVFTFTGQGSQYAGMGKQLFVSSRRFRETVESLQGVCTWQGFPSFIKLIVSGDVDIKSYNTVQVQLAIVVLELALADLWKSWGIQPDLVIGYSLGEYAALHVAGVLSIHDVLYLVGGRATLIQDRCTPGTHAMLAIQASQKDVEEELLSHQFCEVSCKGAPRSTVISGPTEAVIHLQSQLKEKGLLSTMLEIPYGFHSPQVDPILEDFKELAESVNFAKPQIPVASTLEGIVVREAGVFSPSYLAKQARKPVDFAGALEACRADNLVDGGSVWIEIGPQPVLSTLVGATLNVNRSKLLHTINNKDENWKTISASTTSAYLEGMPLSWVKFHQEYVQCLTLLELPTYAFDLKKYWVTNNSSSPGANQVPAPVANPALPAIPGFPTITLQRVQRESLNGPEAVVTFESMTCEPTLLALIQGHLINGVPLCPASAFMDMAFSAAKYIYQRTKPGTSVPPMSLTDLNIIHPLIPDPKKKPDQVVITRAAKTNSSLTVEISFSSCQGKFSDDHGSCYVHFGDENEWKAEWSRNTYFVNAAKENLVKGAKAGIGHRLQKAVVYKLFANLVLYDESFQAMEEVFVEEDFSRNAVARVKLPSVDTHSFTFSPYWADSLIHVAGFVLNGKPDVGDDDFYIASGFGNFRVLEGLQPGAWYESYVHISQITSQGTATCDVYIFDGDQIVGSSTGIIFQRMTRRVLEVVIGRGEGARTSNRIPIKSINVPINRPPQPRIEAPRNDTASGSSSEIGDSETMATSVDGDEAEKAIEIILARTGFDLADVEPFTRITDMGLDSLLTIEVIDEIKNTMGIELPASFFNHNPTVADVKKALRPVDDKPRKRPAPGPAPVSVPAPAPVTVQAPTGRDDAEKTIEVILSRTGFDPADVEPFTRIVDMGLDSLLTIEIISEIKNNLGIELSASFFNHNPTVADVRRALGADDESEENLPQALHSGNPDKEREVAVVGNPTKPLSSYHSKVVLVQGSAKSKKTPLFFITDGAGSATSYMHFPPLFSGDNPVFACESPFLDKPEEFTCSIEEASDLYAAAIRKIQPHGPYLIGGWSLGGLYAFEVSKRLLNSGEIVQGLFVLDFKFPTPSKAKNKVEPTMEMVEMIGVANGVNIPGKGFQLAPMPYKTKMHSLQSVRAVVKYIVEPMRPDRTPINTYVIWAGHGLETLLGEIPAGIEDMLKQEKLHSNPETDTQAYTMLLWFFGKRRESEGPDGWEMATQSPVQCSTLPCDHFSMVNKSFAEHTGKHLKGLISQSLSSRDDQAQ